MSEETRKAKSAVPKAMVWSIGINGTLGVVMAGVLLIYMGDVTSVLGSANPFATILLTATGSKAATTVVISCFILLSLNGSITTISSVSRLSWAWARSKTVEPLSVSAAPTYTADDVQLEKTVHVRRVFSYAQFFAFSLAYMGVWEGVCV